MAGRGVAMDVDRTVATDTTVVIPARLPLVRVAGKIVIDSEWQDYRSQENQVIGVGRAFVRNTRLAILVILVAATEGQNKHLQKLPQQETSHLHFVEEYVRELIADEELKVHGQKEFGEARTPEEQISTGIYFSRSMQLELNSQVRILGDMRLGKPFETLIPGLIKFFRHEIELHQRLIDMNSKLVAGPQPGVDYATLSAKLPQIRADLEQTQKAVFEASPLIFMVLIDQKPDSENHLSHLVITKAEKAQLESLLDIMLKDEPDEGDHDYYVSSAMVLRAGLKKGHKCADEPWE